MCDDVVFIVFFLFAGCCISMCDDVVFIVFFFLQPVVLACDLLSVFNERLDNTIANNFTSTFSNSFRSAVFESLASFVTGIIWYFEKGGVVL